MTEQELKNHALNMRKTALKMALDCGGSAHLGGGLSCVDILTVLYGEIMNCREKDLPFDQKDKFILSKGHGVLGLYTALVEFEIFPKELLETFQRDGSDLIAHPVLNEKLGLESSSGSLGQGISMAVGLALSAKKKNYSYKTYVICGNGECNEGSVWEAVMSAVQFGLDNLTIIVDNNHMQSDGASDEILNVSNRYAEVFKSFGCETFEVDGHNISELSEILKKISEVGRPKTIVAQTVKGKGIGFMENNNEWHHNRLTEKQYQEALEQLEANQ